MTSNNFEKSVENLAYRFERGMILWVKNDRFFDFLRGTGARVLLSLASWLILVVYGWVVYTTQSAGLFLYTGSVVACVLAQKLSVRFAFDSSDSTVLDEYRRKRRDASYRKAYRRMGLLAGFALAYGLLYAYAGFYAQNGYFSFLPSLYTEVQLDAYRIIVLLVFLWGLFTLMPYLAWGYRGEIRRAKD